MYNEDFLYGEWLALPADEDEIEEAMKHIGISTTNEYGITYEEYFITDYEGTIIPDKFGEYTPIEEINDFAQELDDYVSDESDLELIKDVFEITNDLDSAIEVFRTNGYILYQDCYSMRQVAEEYAYNLEFEEVDEAYKKAVENGATPVLEPELEPWGQRTCYIADPEGKLIEIGS